MAAVENDYIEVARIATERANLAEWRAQAIRTVQKGLAHLNLAYQGNTKELAEIEKLRVNFKGWSKERLEKLDEIAATARAQATWAMDQHNDRT